MGPTAVAAVHTAAPIHTIHTLLLRYTPYLAFQPHPVTLKSLRSGHPSGLPQDTRSRPCFLLMSGMVLVPPQSMLTANQVGEQYTEPGHT